MNDLLLVAGEIRECDGCGVQYKIVNLNHRFHSDACYENTPKRTKIRKVSKRKYTQSEKGKAMSKAYRERNRLRINKCHREWTQRKREKENVKQN